jgi:phosphoribosylformylglycinamidine synthase subunit PurS
MNFVAEIKVMTKKEILDPQGKAVKLGLENLGLSSIEDVRIGKNLVLNLTAESETQAQAIVENACQKLLANLIMETYQFEIRAV